MPSFQTVLMHVILLFVKTVRRLPVPLRQLLNQLLNQLFDLYTFGRGEASILKIYLQDKFPMGNLVNLVRNGILTVLDDEATGLYCCFYFFLSLALCDI
jgi:hypothetical protein